MEAQKEQVSELQQQKAKLQDEVSKLTEEIKACKDLLLEKHRQTEGAEKEQAEANVLLMEAQQILNHKITECEDLSAQIESLKKENSNMEAELNQI